MDRWHQNQVPQGRASYAKLMSMCALSAYRTISGATVSTECRPPVLDPDFYLHEALAAIPAASGGSFEFEYLQAIGIVCLTARERANAQLLHQYLGLYHGVLAEQGFHDE